MKFDVCELNYVCFMSLLQMFEVKQLLLGVLKTRSSTEPRGKFIGSLEFKGLVESNGISMAGGYAQGSDPWIASLHQSAMQEELGKLIPKVQAQLPDVVQLTPCRHVLRIC